MTVIGHAAHLMRSVVCATPPTEEMRSSAIQALKSEQFRLGDEARQVLFAVLEGLVKGEVQLEGFTLVLEQMWELHQLDEIESLECTDVVARFVKRFRR